MNKRKAYIKTWGIGDSGGVSFGALDTWSSLTAALAWRGRRNKKRFPSSVSSRLRDSPDPCRPLNRRTDRPLRSRQPGGRGLCSKRWPRPQFLQFPMTRLKHLSIRSEDLWDWTGRNDRGERAMTDGFSFYMQARSLSWPSRQATPDIEKREQIFEEIFGGSDPLFASGMQPVLALIRLCVPCQSCMHSISFLFYTLGEVDSYVISTE
jgi:hypothetical protein